MDNLGRIALIGGTGILLGAAIQRASDIRERNEERAEEHRARLESKVEDQKREIERLKRTQDSLLEKKG